MVIRNGGNVHAINKLSDINHDLVATSTVPSIHQFIYSVHFLFAYISLKTNLCERRH